MKTNWDKLKRQKRLLKRKLRRANRLKGRKHRDPKYLENMPYVRYLTTRHWSRLREKALERDGYSCANCHVLRTGSVKLQVHHKTYARRGREKLGDLITLCETCHQSLHEQGRIGLAENIDLIHWRNGKQHAMRRIAI